MSTVTLGVLLLVCGGPASVRAGAPDCEYWISPDAEPAVWNPMAQRSAYENWKLAQGVAAAKDAPAPPLPELPTIPEVRDAVADRVRIDSLGVGPDKHHVITFDGKTGGPPILVLRGAQVGERYQGEIRVGDRVRFQGYVQSDGAFLISRATDVQLLQVALQRVQAGLVLREVTKVQVSGAGVAGSQGFQGGVSVNVPIAMPEYGGATLPLRLDLMGGPDVLPKLTPGEGVQVTAVPSINFSVGMDF